MMLTEAELKKRITARDALEHKFCVRGQRRLWNASPELTQGVSFEEFVKQGVSVEWLLGTNNPYAKALVQRVLGKKIHGQ